MSGRRRMEYRCTNASCAERGIPHCWFGDEVAENIDPIGLDARCPRCGFTGTLTGMGEVTVVGHSIQEQLAHGSDCGGWIVHEFEVRVGRDDGKYPVPTFRDCPKCRPGKAAVFDAGLMQRGWNESPRAIKVYLEAEVKAGHDWPAEFPNGLWRKVAKEIAGGGF